MDSTHGTKPFNTLHFDWLLFALIGIQIIIGLFFQLSASVPASERFYADDLFLFKQHILHLGVSIALGVVTFHFYSSEALKRYSTLFLVLSFALLCTTLFWGYENNGSNREFNIGGHWIYTFPFVLLLVLVYLTHFFSTHLSHNIVFSKTTLKPVTVLLGITVILYIQPDFNAMLLLSALLLILVAAAKWVKFLVVIVLLSVLIIPLSIVYSSYRFQRLSSFLDPFGHEWDSGYQLVQSLTAIGGGDLWGTSFGHGIVKSLLPSAHEGFVMAAMSEEIGAVGILLILFSSLIVFIRCFALVKQLKRTHQEFEALLVLVLSSCFAMFSLAHVAVNCGLLPTANIPYPLMSHGFSFLAFFIIAFALILRIDANSRLQLTETVTSEPANKHWLSFSSLSILALITCLFIFITYQYLDKAVNSEQLNTGYLQQRNAHQDSLSSSLNKPNSYQTRASILDRNGRILVKSVEMADIYLDPVKFDLAHSKVPDLLKLLSIDNSLVTHRAKRLKNQHVRYYSLKRSVDVDTARIVRGFGIQGLFVKSVSRREYPLGEATTSLLGLTDIDNRGISGIELSQNTNLSKKHDVSLTIDSELQKIAYLQLKHHLIKNQVYSGSVILANSENGEILAMANYPSSSPANRNKMPRHHLRNDAVNNLYQPQNLISPLIAIAAYNTGEYGFETQIDTSPGYVIINSSFAGGETQIKIEDEQQYGSLPIIELINSNSHVGLIKLARQIPKAVISEVFTDIGFGMKTDLGLIEEAHDRIPYPSDWSEEKLADIAIGKGFMLTPVQLLQSFIPYANRSQMHRLSILTDPKVKHSYSTFMTPNGATEIKESMKIDIAPALGLALYGKSTLIAKPNFIKGNENRRYTGIFVGLAERYHTKLAIIIVINEPKVQAGAADIAQRLAVEIIDKSVFELDK